MKPFYLILFIITSKINVLGQIQLNPAIRNNAVLAQFTGSSGSGFYIQDSGNIYFASAYHVLFNLKSNMPYEDSLTLISYRNDVEIDNKSILRISIISAIKSNSVRLDPQNDIVLIKIAVYKPLDTLGNATIIYSPFAVKLTPSARINSWYITDILHFNQIEAATDIYIIGYPKSLGLQGRFDLDRPLFRKGIVAGKDFKFHRIIGDGAVYFGNSGGMVVELYFDKEGKPSMQLIGIVSEYIPYNDYLIDAQGNVRGLDAKNSGYSVIVPADEIYDLVKTF